MMTQDKILWMHSNVTKVQNIPFIRSRIEYKRHQHRLTLDHHLVTGNQYLLAVTGLCILEYGGSRLGSCCCVGHGQSLKALDAICTIISQLDGSTLCDCN